MKNISNFLLLLLLFDIHALAQTKKPHLSNFFTIEKELNIQIEVDGRIVGGVYHDTLLYCSPTAFIDKENNFQATIYMINAKTGEQTQFLIPFPENRANNAAARRYWIYGIGMNEKQLILSTQFAILLYSQASNGRFEFVQKIPTDMPVFSCFHKGSIFFACMDNATGFKLYEQKLRSDKQLLIYEFKLDAPFLLQYGPNGFIKATHQFVYFLNTPSFLLQKFTLKGEKMAEIKIELPNWKQMDQAYIQQLEQMDYGGDRAMYSLYHSKPYSFPLEVIPINDHNFLLTYHCIDTIAERDAIEMIWLTTNDDWTDYTYQPCSFMFDSNHVMQQSDYPVYYYQYNKILSVTNDDRLWQIAKESDLPYCGKKWGTYETEQEQFYTNHEPIIKLRVLKYNNKNSLLPHNSPK